MLSSFIKFSSPNGSLKNNMVFSHFGQVSVTLSFQKSIYYYFIINTTSCKTCFADIQKWTPWTVEWGRRNCGLQGHSRVDPAKATLNCLKGSLPRCCHSTNTTKLFSLFSIIFKFGNPRSLNFHKKAKLWRILVKARLFARWRHFTAYTRILQSFAFCANWDYCYNVIYT